ncbi:fatty acid desaturase [Pseudomonadota bacterium]
MSSLNTTTIASDSLSDVRQYVKAHFPLARETATRSFIACYLGTLIPFLTMLAVSSSHPEIPAFLATAIVAGFTQNAMGILMHEGSHYFFHKSPIINDRIADIFVCLPIFNTVAGYRRLHSAHHQNSGTERDPSYDLYAKTASRTEILIGALKDVAGLTAISSFMTRYINKPGGTTEPTESPWAFIKLITVQAGIAYGLFWSTGIPYAYLLLWILPLLTIPPLINRIRTIVEHASLTPESRMDNRTTLSGRLEQLFFAPYGYMHHFEHHLCPYIPFYQLSCFRNFLRDNTGINPDLHSTQGGYLHTFFSILKSRKC